ncbi:MAG TPA: ABC transporter ATP-binding protein [Phycisphaerae bacterium]|nr:ABC transporter ATP-binding protein [Phycisphaerae bacterium]
MLPAIHVEDLGKRYKIGVRAPDDQNFREALVGLLTAPVRRFRTLSEHAEENETIWALKEFDLEVQSGEVIGVIGRNGAGKSTLLKILSRITEPTTGRVELRGHVASLLEVGTGFHAELTGRENIFLAGAIHGMRRAEIVRKFDQITAFADIERFLDTPVKRYSSGMYVRLAFAVAAHLEPEILLVDEVLAVGDVEFQRKCLGRMREVAGGGRTVLFVSHNMVSIESLCNRAVLLEEGRKTMEGGPAQVIETYLASFRRSTGSVALRDRTDRSGGVHARFTDVHFYDADGHITASVPMGGELTVEAEFVCNQRLSRPRFLVLFINAMGQTIFHAKSHAAVDVMPDAGKGGNVQCRFPALNLPPGMYSITLRLNDSVAQRVDGLEMAASIEVTEVDVYGTGRGAHEPDDVMFMPSEWAWDYT